MAPPRCAAVAALRASRLPRCAGGRTGGRGVHAAARRTKWSTAPGATWTCGPPTPSCCAASGCATSVRSPNALPAARACTRRGVTAVACAAGSWRCCWYLPRAEPRSPPAAGRWAPSRGPLPANRSCRPASALGCRRGTLPIPDRGGRLSDASGDHAERLLAARDALQIVRREARPVIHGGLGATGGVRGRVHIGQRVHRVAVIRRLMLENVQTGAAEVARQQRAVERRLRRSGRRGRR